MSYYTLLGLQKEPFATSPDPAFFYLSPGHREALNRIEIAIHLRRGLSLIVGDVGTGKTTLLRTLIQRLEKDDIITHVLFDPSFSSEEEFFIECSRLFGLPVKKRRISVHKIKSALKEYLFETGIHKNKIIVLIIDEAQKLSLHHLEHLRMLLNYETNEFKLLQIVLFSQMEILPNIKKAANIIDRISLKYVLQPLDKEQTYQLILFRLQKAGHPEPARILNHEAADMLYEITRGYPRQINYMCHRALEEALMAQSPMISVDIIQRVLNKETIVNQTLGLFAVGRDACTSVQTEDIAPTVSIYTAEKESVQLLNGVGYTYSEAVQHILKMAEAIECYCRVLVDRKEFARAVAYYQWLREYFFNKRLAVIENGKYKDLAQKQSRRIEEIERDVVILNQ